jgi:hypothetical protein
MKLIHGSLSSLLGELKGRGKVDGVRVAALMQSVTEGSGVPRYTSWVIGSAQVDWETWAEWRLVVGRQRAEVTEAGIHVPGKLAALMEAKLAEVKSRTEAAGLAMCDGILAADAETLEGAMGRSPPHDAAVPCFPVRRSRYDRIDMLGGTHDREGTDDHVPAASSRNESLLVGRCTCFVAGGRRRRRGASVIGTRWPERAARALRREPTGGHACLTCPEGLGTTPCA